MRTRAAALAAATVVAIAWGSAVSAQEAAPDAPAAPGPARAAIVSIEGGIDELTGRTLESRVKRALESSPRFLIVRIDSPGGEVEAGRDIAWNLSKLKKERDVTVVAWIDGRALSIATFVAFGCDEIAMRPDAQLGDCLPILVERATQIPVGIAEKLIAPMRQDLRDLASLRGYPLDVADAMVDPSVVLHRLEVKDAKSGRTRPEWHTAEHRKALPFEHQDRIVKDEVVNDERQLLVISSEQALDMQICKIVAPDEAALLATLARDHGLPSVEAVRIADLWWADVVRFVTWTPIKTLLFIIGVIALVVALTHPGLWAPELVAASCFGLVFGGSYLIGVADSIEVVMFVVGLVLLIIELVTPGFGVIGLSGIGLMIVSLLLSYQRFVVPTTPAEWDTFRASIAWTVCGLTGSAVGLVILARVAPKTLLLRGLVLAETLPAGDGTGEPTVPGATPGAAPDVPIGATGTAHTSLRPVGKVRLGDALVEAVAEDGFVDAGAVVVVVGRRAAEIVVASRPEATAPPRAPAPGAPPPSAAPAGGST